MSTYRDPTPKATFATSGNAEIRCNGKLTCDCGRRVKAHDIEIEELEDGTTFIKLICPGCHADGLVLEFAL
jgi:hypothetical protein